MHRVQVLATVIASAGFALCLGLADDETRSVCQSCNAGNAPFTLFVTAAECATLPGAQLAVKFAFSRRAVRSKLVAAPTPRRLPCPNRVR